MDNLYYRIRALHPTLIAGKDFDLRDDSDGEGAKIVRWSAAVPQPSEAELLAANWQSAVPDPSDIERMEKAMKALALLVRQYCNALAGGTYTAKTVPQLKSDFKAIYDALS